MREPAGVQWSVVDLNQNDEPERRTRMLTATRMRTEASR
jgi:hypothetical protein